MQRFHRGNQSFKVLCGSVKGFKICGGSKVACSQRRQVVLKTSSHCYAFMWFFSVSGWTTDPMLCILYLLRRGLTQGSAFVGCHQKSFLWGDYIFPLIFRGLFYASWKSLITFKWWEIGEKFQRLTCSKLGSRNRMTTSFMIQHAPSGLNWYSAICSYRKTAYAVEAVQDVRKMLLEHE